MLRTHWSRYHPRCANLLFRVLCSRKSAEDGQMCDTLPTRLIVGITGATGTIFGVRLLQMLQGSGIETHLVISKWGARTLVHETDFTVDEVQRMATQSHPV